MNDWNLPDGCTNADIDKAMNVTDNGICFDCEFWEPIYCSENNIGICGYSVMQFSNIYDGIAHDIAEYCITKYNDVCDAWENYDWQTI